MKEINNTTMKTDNYIIDEFMGLQCFSSYKEMQACPIEELTAWTIPDDAKWGNDYAKDWNKLMPVVEKIAWTEGMAPQAKEMAEELTIFSPIEAVYEQVIIFIKQFNLQPKQ